MKRILSSPTKLVFILMAVAVIVGYFTGKMSEANFLILANGAFAYYYTKNNSNNETPQI